MLGVRPICLEGLPAAPGALRAGSERIFRAEIFVRTSIRSYFGPQVGRAKFWRWIHMPGGAELNVGFYSKDPT